MYQPLHRVSGISASNYITPAGLRLTSSLQPTHGLKISMSVLFLKTINSTNIFRHRRGVR